MPIGPREGSRSPLGSWTLVDNPIYAASGQSGDRPCYFPPAAEEIRETSPVECSKKREWNVTTGAEFIACRVARALQGSGLGGNVTGVKAENNLEHALSKMGKQGTWTGSAGQTYSSCS